MRALRWGASAGSPYPADRGYLTRSEIGIGSASVASALVRVGECETASARWRHPRRQLEEMVDEVKQSIVGPLRVLEDEDERTMVGQSLEKPPPGGEGLVPVVYIAATHSRCAVVRVPASVPIAEEAGRTHEQDRGAQ